MAPLSSRSINAQAVPAVGHVAFCRREQPSSTLKENSPLSMRSSASRVPTPATSSLNRKSIGEFQEQDTPLHRTSTPTSTSISKLPRRTKTPSHSGLSPRNSKRASTTAGQVSAELPQTQDGQQQDQEGMKAVSSAADDTTTQWYHLAAGLDKPLPPRPLSTSEDDQSLARDSRSSVQASGQTHTEGPHVAVPPVLSSVEELAASPAFTHPLTLDGTPEVKDASVGESTEGFHHSLDATDATDMSPGAASLEKHASLRETATFGDADIVRSEECSQAPGKAIFWPRDHLMNRTSVTAGPTGAGETTTFTDGYRDRPHSPNPVSFSQPRLKQSSSPIDNTPRQSRAMASRIPLYDPKKAPQVVHIKKTSALPTQVPRDGSVPTFGGRRLDKAEDFAALMQESPKRKHLVRSDTNADQESLTRRVNEADSASSYNGSVRVKRSSPQTSSDSFYGNILGFSDHTSQSFEVASHDEKVDDPTTRKEARHSSSHLNTCTTLSSNEGILHMEPRQGVDGSNAHDSRAAPWSGAMSTSDNSSGNDLANWNEPQQQVSASLSFFESVANLPNSFEDDLKVMDRMLDKDAHQHAPAFRSSTARPSSSGLMSEVDESENMHGQDADYNSKSQRSEMASTLPRYALQTSTAANGRPRSKPTGRTPSYAQQTTASSGRNPTRLPSRGSRTSLNSTGIRRRNSYGKPLADGCPLFEDGGVTQGRSESAVEHEPKSQVVSGSDQMASMNMRALADGLKLPAKDAKPRHKPSRSRFVHNMKGLFSTKRKTSTAKVQTSQPRASTMDEQSEVGSRRSKVTCDGSPVAKTSSSMRARARLPINRSLAGSGPSALETRDTTADLFDLLPGLKARSDGQIQSMDAYVRCAIEESQRESNLQRKERLLSIAAVMIDAITHSRQAEKSMLEARQAAETAKASYEMIQRSVIEMGRLLNKSHSMPTLLRRLTARGSR